MNNLRRIRRSADLTQQELADKTNLSKSYICDVEKGNVVNPSLYKCYDIAECLGVDLLTIFPKEL